MSILHYPHFDPADFTADPITPEYEIGQRVYVDDADGPYDTMTGTVVAWIEDDPDSAMRYGVRFDNGITDEIEGYRLVALSDH